MALFAQGLGIDPAAVKLSEAEIKGDAYARCLDVSASRAEDQHLVVHYFPYN